MNDAIVIGGGTAGAAAGLALARAGYRVTVLERDDEPRQQIGESLPPVIRTYLTRLGIWDAFQSDGHLICGGIRSAWGTAEIATTDHILSPNGQGWIVDRQKFDRMLKTEATRAGADYCSDARAVSWRRSDEGWIVETDKDHDGTLRSRLLIDATGRTGLVARSAGSERTVMDRLVARVCYLMPQQPADDYRPLIETCQVGWWYTVGLPDGSFIAALFTHLDILRKEAHDLIAENALKNAPHTWERIGGMSRISEYKTVSADSYRRDPPGGDNWHAVGDAAIGLDPLSSTGIVWALHSAMEMPQLLASENEAHIHREKLGRDWKAFFEKYDERHRAYMAMERRWPDSVFWNRYR